MVSCCILGVCGIISACAPNYLVFLVARLITGAGAVGLFQINFVLGTLSYAHNQIKLHSFNNRLFTSELSYIL